MATPDEYSTSPQAFETMKQEEWRHAIECFGTAYIFEKRAATTRKKIRILIFTGLVLPLLVGAVVTKFGADSIIFPIIVMAASVLGTIQLVFSLWSLVAGWNDTHSYSLESMADNNRLSSLFKDLAQTDLVDEDLRFNILKAEYRSREALDMKRNVLEKEKRMGMRAALRQFQRACFHCKAVPISMDLKRNPESARCGVCGDY